MRSGCWGLDCMIGTGRGMNCKRRGEQERIVSHWEMNGVLFGGLLNQGRLMEKKTAGQVQSFTT